MAEAVMVLPVLALIWLGLLYVHQLARHVLAASGAARSRSWTHAFEGCRNEDDDEGGGCAAPKTLDLDETGQAAVDDALGELFGHWTRRQARTGFARPAWFGGGQVRITARSCLPCNPVPKASLEVIRRTYEDSRARSDE